MVGSILPRSRYGGRNAGKLEPFRGRFAWTSARARVLLALPDLRLLRLPMSTSLLPGVPALLLTALLPALAAAQRPAGQLPELSRHWYARTAPGVLASGPSVAGRGGTASAAAPVVPGTPITPSRGLVFVGTSVSGAADPHHLLDLASGGALEESAIPETDNVNGAAFASGGRELFVSGGDSVVTHLTHCDLTTSPPTWSVVCTSTGSGPFDVQSDAARGLLYVLDTTSGVGSTDLQAIDVAAGSPTYGQVVASTVGLTYLGFVERFGLSRSGNRAVVIATLNPRLFLVDTDPSSPTYLGVLYEVDIPYQSSMAPLATEVVVTGNDAMALVTLQHMGTVPSEIARFDLLTYGFIDSNPGASGTQHIGPDSQPAAALGSAAFDLDIARGDSFAVVCGWGNGGWAGRIGLDPTIPTFWSYTAYSPASGLSDAWALDLTSDDRHVAIETVGEVLILDAQTGVERRAISISSTTNVYTVATHTAP